MDCSKISRYIIFFVPFTAIVVLPWVFFPFVVGKYVFFRALIDLSLIFFAWGWANGKVSINRKSLIRPIAVCVAVFAIAFLLASFFSYDPLGAFWGNFERGESGVQMFHLLAFFFLMAVLFRSEDDWRKMMKLVVIAALLSMFYGFLAGSVNGFIGDRFSLSNRFQGSLGNPDYVGQFMIFAVFFALYLTLSSETKYQSYWYGFSAMSFFIFLLLSQTRGAFLGFSAGVFAFLIYLILKIPEKRLKLVFGSMLLLSVSGLILLVSFHNYPLVKKTPVIKQIANISLKDGSMRIWAWESAAKGIVDRPILGWGPENFSVVFDKYFNTRHFAPPAAISSTWFDRAHSVIFDYGAETGLLGLASYLGIFVFYYVQFYRSNKLQKTNNFRKSPSVADYKQLTVKALFFSMPVAYLVAGATIFDVLPIYMMLFVFLGFANFKLQDYVAKIPNHKS